MKARVPATVAFLAAALASAVSGLSFIRHAGAQRMEKLAPVETVTVAPGTFTYRLPGEYLRDGRPVDAPTRQVTFRTGFGIMKYQVGADDYANRAKANGFGFSGDERWQATRKGA